MVNNRRASNIEYSEYISIIQTQAYVDNSSKNKLTSHGIKYYEADYLFNGNLKKVFHFILNLK